ncbi:MAG: ComEC/Rec2 family competence protein [Minisyncoccia bacterium]
MTRKPSKQSLQYIVVGIFLFTNIFIWTVVARADRNGILTVAFLEVGQGDAIYIEAPNGNQMLIDGGPSSGALLRALGSVMPFWDRSIDVVIATHPDQDHVGGLPAVIDRMSVDSVVITENTSDTGAYSAFEKAIAENKSRRILARAGERIILDNGVVLEILFPDRNTTNWESNTSSIIARLSYREESFIFTGDAPESIEKYIVSKSSGELHSSVLKLGHHGSRTSSSKIFLSAVDPKYAVISAGKDNKYGHPHKEVTDLLGELKIPAVRTYEQGTIIFETNGNDLLVK